MPTDATPARQLTTQLTKLIPIVGAMGIEVVELRPGFVQTRVPFEGNGNHFGVMYAGVIFSVAEVLGGAIHWATFDATTHYPLVRSIAIDYLKPGTTALTATGRLSDAEVARIKAAAAAGAKVPFVFETEVHGEDGTLVATTRGDYQLRPVG